MINTTAQAFIPSYARPINAQQNRAPAAADARNSLESQRAPLEQEPSSELRRKVEALEIVDSQPHINAQLNTLNRDVKSDTPSSTHANLSAEEIRTAEPVGFDAHSYNAVQTFVAIKELEPSGSLIDLFV